MDEILIEEKRYVSSKRAAKMTGYAKDYIGQLCREGRVPARLVGRSWYVLESAIQDHRFGEQKNQQEIKGGNLVKGSSIPEFAPAWESPRYEAVSAEVLPTVNRLRDIDQPQDEEEGKDGISQHLQNSWREWFDRVDEVVAPSAPEKRKEEELEMEKEVPIPIHTVYDLPPEDLLPPRQNMAVEPVYDEEELQIRRKRGGRGAMVGIQIAGAVLAVLVATVAVIGTGYFDKYIISNSQVGLIAGVAVYNK